MRRSDVRESTRRRTPVPTFVRHVPAVYRMVQRTVVTISVIRVGRPTVGVVMISRR